MQKFEPKNEMGVIVLFSSLLEKSGWEILEIGAAFPDATLRKDGEVWKTEFEYFASSFLYHDHDCRMCDLIICWENDYLDSPLPIIAISKSEWWLDTITRCEPIQKEAEYWKRQAEQWRRRCLRAESNLRAKAKQDNHPTTVAQEKITDNLPSDPVERMNAVRQINIQIRRSALLDIIKESELPISEIATRLDVSENTIRKDLEALQSVGHSMSINGVVKLAP